MIPHMLSMEGFGSYIKETVVDFDSADDIFLISGDTGAGKSLILDAVVYALFGKGSGDRTEFVSRCLHGDGRRMKVLFRFEAAGDMYEFERSVRFSRPRKGGGSVKSVSEAAVYIYENGVRKQINEKNTDSEANRIAENILKMSLEQFRQIIVLPQGKIESLLTGSSKDKQKLFTDLFGTTEIDRIAAALKKTVDDERRILSDKQKRLEIYLLPDFSDIGELEKRVTEQENEQKLLSEKMLETDSDIKAAGAKLAQEERLYTKFEELRSLKLSLIALEEKEDIFRAKKERLAELDFQIQLLGEYRVYNDVRRELEERIYEEKQAGDIEASAVLEKQAAEKALEEYKKNAKAAETAREKAALLSEYIKKKEVTDRLEKRFKTAAFDAEKAKKTYGEAAEKFEEYKSLTSECEKKADAFDIGELNRLCGEYSALMQSMETGRSVAGEAAEKLSEAQKLREQRKLILKQCAEAEDNKKRLDEEYEAAFEAHIGGLAAELSEELAEGEKCPVCGSIHHPEPYRLQAAARVSANELRNKKTAAEKASAAVSEEKNRLSAADSKISEAEKTAADSLKKAAEYGYSEDGYRQLSEKIKDINDKLAQYKILENDIKEMRNELEKYRAAADSAKADLAEKESIKMLSEQEYQIQKASCDDNISLDCEPEKELKKLTKIYTEYEKKLRELSGGLSEASNKSISAEVQHKTAENELEKCRGKYNRAYDALAAKLIESGITAKAEEFVIDEKGISAIDVLRKECEDHYRDLEDTRKKTALLDKELEGKLIPDTAVLKAKLEELEKKRGEINKVLIETEVSLSDLRNRRDAYMRESSDYVNAREIFERKNSFSEMINGNTEMSFSRYVLGVMLDRVLDTANIMLERILDSNYRLYRSTEGKKTSKLGLDINVINYSVDAAGADYPVKELSGGEKFVMSVILGLAIAETAQNRTGGIKVNSMFIDEGFGTLDEETLLRIMNILRAFGKGKKIGIISHVESLSGILSGFAVTRSAGEGSTVGIKK